ncbi:MAG: hypothetical protein HZB13_05610 [Acidobacteria bacterium]|nr:hypothetical protein [Acidobacteriota bacterium]
MKRLRCWIPVVCLLAFAGPGMAQMTLEQAQKMAAAQPGSANGWYAVGALRWAEAYRPVMEVKKSGDAASLAALKQKLAPGLADGHKALARAIRIDPNFADAMLYDNLLFRLDAEFAPGDAERKSLFAQADKLLQKAIELNKAGKATVRDPSLPPPPPPPPPKK